MKPILKRQEGQAAVEALFSIPIMLFLFLIGFQLFTITWNAQYAHVRSRYEVIHTYEAGDRTNSACGSTQAVPVNADVQGDTYLMPQSLNRPIKNVATVVCQ